MRVLWEAASLLSGLLPGARVRRMTGARPGGSGSDEGVNVNRHRRRRRVAMALCAATALSALAACGGATDTTRLTWYINPDGGGSDPNGKGQAQIARECTEAAGGEYSLEVQLLPNSASDQRQQLIRRLAAQDPG